MEKDKKVVLVDMDGVLVKLIPHVLKRINADWDTKYTEEDIKDFALEKSIDLPPAVIYRYFCEHHTFGKDRPPYEDARKIMAIWHDDEEIWPIICTSPMVAHPNCEREKREWVEEHLPWFPQKDIIFTTHKWLIDGDFLIDDKPFNVRKFSEQGGMSIVMDRPWNQGVLTSNDIVRCCTWNDVFRSVTRRVGIHAGM